MSVTVEQRAGGDRRRITRSGRRGDDPRAPNRQAAFLASLTSDSPRSMQEAAPQPFHESRAFEPSGDVRHVDDENRGDPE